MAEKKESRLGDLPEAASHRKYTYEGDIANPTGNSSGTGALR